MKIDGIDLEIGTKILVRQHPTRWQKFLIWIKIRQPLENGIYIVTGK